MEASRATPSSASSSPVDNTNTVTSTISFQAGGSSKRDPRVDKGGSQPWKYYTCPKNCGFHSRNKERFENHMKNCGSAPTKKVETNQYAPRADGTLAPTPSDNSAAGTRLEPLKIFTCPKCGYKSSKKARMDVHNCQPVTQLKAKEVSPVPEQVTKQMESAKQPRPSTSKAPELPRYKCSLCGFHSTESKFLANHEKLHVVKSHYQCPHCSYSIGNQAHLARHVIRDHPELLKASDDPQFPDVVPVKEQPMQNLNKELAKKRIHPVFNDRRRQQNVEAERREQEQPLNKELPKKRVEVNHSGLQKRVASKEPPLTEASSDEETPKKRRGRAKGPVVFQCGECEFSATYSFGLKQHQKCHERNGKFKCDRCSYSAQMERHVTVHVDKYHQNAPQEALPPPEVGRRAVTPDPPRNIRNAAATPQRNRTVAMPLTPQRAGTPKQDRAPSMVPQRAVTPDPSKKIRNVASHVTPQRDLSANTSVSQMAVTPDSLKRSQKVAVTPRRERAAPTKSLVTDPAEQLENRGATEGAQDEEEDVLPDLATDYFLLLEETFATFADRQISLEELEDLVNKTKDVAGLDAAEVRFVEDIALVASVLYDTYLSIEEEYESGTSNDEKLESLKTEMEEMEYRVRMGSKEIRKLSNQQDSIQTKIEQLGADKVKAEMVVNKREYATLQLKLNAKQSASSLRAYQDALDQVRRSKDRVRSLVEELEKAEEDAEDLAAELDEVEEENAQDMRSLLMIKKEVVELEKAAATGQDSVESRERIKELHETAVNQRRALCVLHDRLLKLTYIKMMELIDAEEKQWLEMLDKS